VDLTQFETRCTPLVLPSIIQDIMLIVEYVQIKPILVIVTIISKATGTYREGKFAPDSGYTYVSVVYNTSICLSL